MTLENPVTDPAYYRHKYNLPQREATVTPLELREENPPSPPAPVPPVAPVAPDLGETLQEVSNWLKRFLYIENPEGYDLLTLWIAHTWLVEELYSTPRLLLSSPVPGSGKTTVLEHIERLGRQYPELEKDNPKPMKMGNLVTPALLGRLLLKGTRILLLDEADRSLDPKDPGTAARLGILNTGYKKGGNHTILEKMGNRWEPLEIPTFAPVVIAGNSPLLPDDTLERCIEITLLRDPYGDIEDSDWEEIEPEAQDLQAALRQAIEGAKPRLGDTRKASLPVNCRGRDKERWRPIKRTAALAGPDWEAIANQLIESDLQRKAEERESGDKARPPWVVLLEHLSTYYSESSGFAPTRSLREWLTERYPSHWGEESHSGRPLSDQRLGSLLSTKYRIHSQRPDSRGPRGYSEQQFRKVWESLGIRPPVREPAQPAEPAEPAQPSQDCPLCREPINPRILDHLGGHPWCLETQREAPSDD